MFEAPSIIKKVMNDEVGLTRAYVGTGYAGFLSAASNISVCVLADMLDCICKIQTCLSVRCGSVISSQLVASCHRDPRLSAI